MKPTPLQLHEAKHIVNALAWALGRPAQTISNITFGPQAHCNKEPSMSGTQPQGTNIGTFTAPTGDKSVNFNANIVSGTSDGTPPAVTLLNGAAGTVAVGPLDPTGTFYPVTVSNMAWSSTNIIEVAGDSVDDCYLTVIIGPQTQEQFTVDPSSVTFSA
jgi:hypothetical protein